MSRRLNLYCIKVYGGVKWDPTQILPIVHFKFSSAYFETNICTKIGKMSHIWDIIGIPPDTLGVCLLVVAPRAIGRVARVEQSISVKSFRRSTVKQNQRHLPPESLWWYCRLATQGRLACHHRVYRPAALIGHIWIEAKTCPTSILVMAKPLVFVWLVSNYLACQWLFGQCSSLFLPMLANLWATKMSTKFWQAKYLVG
jgi:hypothetical protein